ncbi:Uncharacterized conserved protein YndB, AHSA1/START domain [Raineyella antarctica]|uniref:Uncharacterized conserved protein YndB, AHSA1/START domain n=1 Tax=Raineyella antarctica TaxID=1577474 RepID=A0A1G6HCH2_9ACTN|nr:SRPBCC domain-containing protein [Raineyella antarctica]SDB92017.1 Uncharacterized conserved protein YndB, AHSA1/START domain [Raineyella antarctica]
MDASAAGFTLEQERVVQATPERVFALLTDRAGLFAWWGPRGFSTPGIDIDLRVGGRYRFTMQPPEGDAFHLSGEYLDLRPPHTLSFTFRWDEPAPDDRETIVVISLDPVGGATKVSLSQGPFATRERLELHRNGWTESFDKLDDVLRSPGPSER